VLIAEYTSEGHVTTTNKPYANSYIAIVRFRDELICAQREYYNPVPASRALAAP
jgi:ketosteroid isomerase-like protein